MTTYYLDTSAVVKLYVQESGSDWVDDLVNRRDDAGQPAHIVAFSRLAQVEVGAALGRLEESGHLAPGDRAALFERFLSDCATRFFTLAVLDAQIRRAWALAFQLPLRGYDAMHLAVALELADALLESGLAAPVFVAADQVLIQAAAQAGLATEYPAGASSEG